MWVPIDSRELTVLPPNILGMVNKEENDNENTNNNGNDESSQNSNDNGNDNDNNNNGNGNNNLTLNSNQYQQSSHLNPIALTSNYETVICMHGWIDNADSFSLIAPLICERYQMRVIAFDHPGHGKSTHNPTGYYSFFDYGVLLPVFFFLKSVCFSHVLVFFFVL